MRFGARKSQKSGFRILTYPINRDTRAIYFNCSYRPLEGPSRPSYLFPRHWSPLFTLHSHKSLKISPYLSWKAVGHTDSPIFSRVSRVSVLRPPAVIRHAAECIERLFYSVFVCPRVSSRTEDYVTWKLHRPSFFGGHTPRSPTSFPTSRNRLSRTNWDTKCPLSLSLSLI